MKKRLLIFFTALLTAVLFVLGLSACSPELTVVYLQINDDGDLIVYYSDFRTENLGKFQGENGQNGQDGQLGQNGQDGRGIKNIELNEDGELIVTYTDNSSVNLGKLQGVNGQDGNDGNDGVGIQNVGLNENGELVITYTNGKTVNLGKVTACEHENFTAWMTVREPDCVTNGYRQRQCSECGHVEYQTTEATGHNFSKHYTVSAPTCTQEGLDLYICRECGTTKAEILEPLEHEFVNYECINCGFETGSPGLVYEEIKNESGEVIAYAVADIEDDAAPDVVIPSLYQGKPVTKIKELAFCGSHTGTYVISVARSVVIGKNVVEIEEGAFADCHTLTSVTIGENVVRIGGGAFYDCPYLETVYWNAKACEYAGDIDSHIFCEVPRIKNIYIGDSVTQIPDFAFEECVRVASLTISSKVTYIGKYAFVNMKSLKDIYYEGTIDEWNAIEKGIYWTVYVPDCTVHCSDGDTQLEKTSFK